MAPAWAGLSAMLALLHASSIPSPALARRARAAAERAIALDSTRYEGYAALTYYHTFIDRDFVRAFAAASRARALAPRDAGAVLALARVEDNLAEFEAARRDLAEAARLDPRNTRVWLAQTTLLLRFGHVAEARAAAERLLALAPTSLGAIRSRVQVELAAGDVTAARRVIARAARDVPREAIVAHLARYYDLGWVLDADQERLLLSLGPDAFDGDRANFAIVRAQQYGWRGDTALARAWGDSAAREFATQLRDAPSDPQLHMLRGLALAYAGGGRKGLAEAERGLVLAAANRESAQYAYFAYVAARAALLVGDRDAALGWLAESRRAHHSAGPAWLRVEPTWKPLRGDPRFAALAKGGGIGR
jgi:Flp pilus assembly protein TadD